MKKLLYTLGISALLLGSFSVKAMDDDKENEVTYCLAELFNEDTMQKIGYYFLDMKLTEKEVEEKVKKVTSDTQFYTNRGRGYMGEEFTNSVFDNDDDSADGVFLEEGEYNEGVVFSEEQLKYYLTKLFSEQINEWKSPHNEGIHKNNEYINKLKESKKEAIIIFKKNGNVITHTLEEHVSEINNKAGDENGDNRFEQDNPLDPNGESSFLTGKKAIFLVLIVVTITGVIYGIVNNLSESREPKNSK